MHDYDSDDYGYLDTKDFASYCDAIYDAFVALGGCAEHREVRRYLCLLYNDRRWKDAIESLMAVGKLRCVREVFPMTYEITAPRAERERRFNGQAKTPAHKGPYQEAFETARDKITA